MSIAQYKVGELWGSFMPLRKTILNENGTDRFSVSVYPKNYFREFDPAKEFIKWAAVEVTEASAIPPGLDSMIIPAGLYAVFHYKGLNTDTSIFDYIFNNWLPKSGFAIDDRPHFEILGAKYKNNDPQSEEEIWIPVKKS